MPYKILVLKNGSNIDVADECAKAKAFFASRSFPIDVEFTFKEINIPVEYKTYTSVQGFNAITGNPMIVDYLGLVDSVKDGLRSIVKEFEYNSVMFISDISNIPIKPGKSYPNWTNWKPLYFNTGFMQVVYNSYLKETKNTENAILHEPMHDFCFTLNRYGFPVKDEMDIDRFGRPYYRNDFPEEADSNFGFTLKNIQPYISKLVPKKGWKYFKESEVVGLDTKLVDMLDVARDVAGISFVITSGLRSGAHNEDVGGVQNSSHLKGLAVDLRARDSKEHYLITKGLYAAGFRRISKKYASHIHCDIDPDKSQDILF